MKIVFWLLDVNYEVRKDGPEVRLWGIDGSGKRVLIIDRNFEPYFYTVVEEGKDPEKVAEQICKEHYSSITKLELVKPRFFGKPVNAVKIYVANPDSMPKCAKDLREIEGIKGCFEDDVRLSMRYLIDNNVVPCGWHEAEISEQKSMIKAQVDRILVAKSVPKLLNKSETPALRILGFSMIRYSKEGSPKPEKSPVIVMSVVTSNDERKQFVAGEDNNDAKVLRSFTSFVREFDPDVIVGYGNNGHDWPYLKQRCVKLGLDLYVDRTETEPHQSTYGHYSVTGRSNIDVLDYADNFPEVKVKTLENLADYLGIMKLTDREIVEEIDYAEYWDQKEKREILKRFSMDNARCLIRITEAVLDFAVQMSALVGLPLDHVGPAAAGFRVEWLIIKRTHEIGELVPKRIEQPYRPYAGAIVISPKPGLHENIASLDFKSMYPSLMIAYNLSPDTYVPPEAPEPLGSVYEAPEVKHKFRKHPAGFYKQILCYLISVRDQVRLQMKKIPQNSVRHRVLDARQRAVKVITNAMYGYAGWTGARWYIKPVAEAAAAWGRHTIQSAIAVAEKMGLEVVYGDTDSIFVRSEEAKIEELEKEVQEKLRLEIKPDKVYVRIFFTEAKKRYAGLLPNGLLDIVGLEVMRGDWAGVAKQVQEKVLEIILREQSAEKAAEFVKQFIYDMRQRRIPYRDLIIWKTLTKPAEEYEVKASHVEAAEMLKEKGWELSIGDKVGYVVVTGTGRLYERVKPYVFAKYDEVDLEYYISKQVVPAAVRILGIFGMTEQQFLEAEAKEARRITDFFKT